MQPPIQPSLFELELPYSVDSAHWFMRVRDLGMPVWLDSARPFSLRGRHDIISAAPLSVVSAADDGCPDAFDRVKQALQQFFSIPLASDWPFSGGAIGFFGYELGRRLERFPPHPQRGIFPALLVGLYSWAIVSDHQTQRTVLLIRPETPIALRDELRHRTQGAFNQSGQCENFELTTAWRDEFPAREYEQSFQRLQAYIQAGDCYQVNLARRFSSAYRGDPWLAYRRLRGIAAAPFSAYLESSEGAILCLSPERFLAAENGRLFTQPIKGTAARSSDPGIDRQLADELRHSEKNRAENLMIVDLLRNDLGRSCKPGSIAVEQLFELQSFATVHHLVSSIRGELRIDRHPLDALRDCFPGGSISGAPKIRAMQIIDELEPQARAVFCGAIGYIGADGRMDSNLTIRTLLASREKIYAWAGGGIVADSDCAEELLETRDKIEPLLRALSDG